MTAATRINRNSSAMSTASETGDDFSDKLAQLNALIADLAKSAPNAATEQLGCIKDGAAALYVQGKEKAVEITGKVVDTVKKYPIQTALAAVGAGLLTWWLLSRHDDE